MNHTNALNGVTSAPPHPIPLPQRGGEGKGEGAQWSVTGINAFILVSRPENNLYTFAFKWGGRGVVV